MGVRVYSIGWGGDPYAPAQPAWRTQPLTLPEGRLRRCGAGDDVLAVYRDWWAETADQSAAVAGLAALSDDQLAEQIEALPTLGDASVAQVVRWVEGYRPGPGRDTAVELALTVERMRDRPRSTLFARLAEITDEA